jgi:hypothetical protein
MQQLLFLSASIFGAISFLFATSESYAQAHTKGRIVAPFTRNLKPGDYTWHAELSPAGPVVVLVSLPDPDSIFLEQIIDERKIDER